MFNNSRSGFGAIKADPEIPNKRADSNVECSFWIVCEQFSHSHDVLYQFENDLVLVS